LKTKKERMRETALKIKQRLKLLKSVRNDAPKFEGMLANNNEMNHLMTYGTSKKTNRNKRKSNYKSKLGGYGVENDYSPHDQRQIDEMNYNEDEE